MIKIKEIFNKFISSIKEQKQIKAEAKRIVGKRKKEEAIKARYYNVAELFNDLHCHTGDDLWMCPTCNKVHTPDVEATKIWHWLTGIHYPACCRFGAGHRLFYELYATTGNQVRG